MGFGYNPPKYACRCKADCTYLEANTPYYPDVIAGGETKEETIRDCNLSIEKICPSPKYRINNISCEVKSWRKWSAEHKDRKR